MKKIGVLTYPVKHRKTFDLLSLLKANGYKDVKVYAIPFHYQKKKFPIYQHRPEMNYAIPETEALCKNFEYECEIGQLEDFVIEEDRIVLIAGAGILPEEFVKTHTIINAHPGYIPNCYAISDRWLYRLSGYGEDNKSYRQNANKRIVSTIMVSE